MQIAASPAPAPKLPELRQDLRLEKAAPAADGTPMWIVIDATQHRYVQVGETAHHLLAKWRPGITYGELQAAVAHSSGYTVTADEIAEFIQFLSMNSLTLEPMSGDWRHYSAVAAQGRHGWITWLIHNYLFIRVPLFQPDAFLRRWLSLVAPLGSRVFAIVVACFGLVGLYLTSRQWDSFTATFEDFFSLEGALTYAVALTIVKSAHELGHAFTAVRYGVRVPSMGVCFLLLFPVLYTDVTDAWRLKSRRARLHIGGAGVAVELALACFATFFWVFLPDGILKGLAFSIATVGWVMSLAVNLNPLMRFDGYYLFADAIGIDNLQARAFALGRWRLREFLFAVDEPAPERLPDKMRRLLIVYAWATWIYRLIVFTGIAVVVYHMTFKLLGIVLFLIEIVYFIIKPVYGEVCVWRKKGRRLMDSTRSRITISMAAVMFLWFVTPWSTRIAIPSILEGQNISRVYPQRPGVVERVWVRVGERVIAGQTLVELSSTEIVFKLKVARRKKALTLTRLARRSVDVEDRNDSLTLGQQLKSLNAEIAGLEREAAELIIRTPAAGIVAELNGEVHPGRTIGHSEFVAMIRSGKDLVARGYIAQADAQRVELGADGYFVPEELDRSRIAVKLDVISTAAAASIDITELASTYGGPIAVRPRSGARGSRVLSPIDARYLATMDASNERLPVTAQRGVVYLLGQAQSPAQRFFRQVGSVLVRESGL